MSGVSTSVGGDRPLEWVDTHCHFDFEDFATDRDSVWRQCQARGVGRLVIPGVTPPQWPRVAAWCAANPGAYYAVGLHPCWLEGYLPQSGWQHTLQQLQDQLQNAAQDPRCVAIGECGLDAWIDGDAQQQQAVLACHLEVAQQLALPVILHCRRAHHDLQHLLKHHPLPRGGVVHAFSGSQTLAEQYWQRGLYLGIGGTITYPRAQKTRATVAAVPLEALLLETDAPDMPLQGRQGLRNSPLHIPEVGAELARLREQPEAQIAEQTTRNAQRLFQWQQNGPPTISAA